MKRRLKKEIKIFGLIVLMLSITLGFFLFTKEDIQLNEQTNILKFDDSAIKTEEKEEIIEEVEYVEYPGFASSYEINNEVRYLTLKNPENNNSYFIYSIFEDDETIYQSEAISPDYEVMVDLFEVLEAGQHELLIGIESYDIKSQTKDFYAPSYKVNINVKKEI